MNETVGRQNTFKLSTERKISFGFGTALVVLILISMVSYRSIQDFSRVADSRQRAERAVKSLKVVFSELQDAETGQRGFLITGQERYLEPYFKGISAITQEVTKVHEFASETTNRERLASLGPLIQGKLAELDQTLKLRQGVGGFEAAKKVVMTDEGRKTMDDIRKVIMEAEQEEEGMAAERDRLVEAQAKQATLVIILGSIFAIGIVITSSLVIRGELGARRRSRAELRTFADSLEEKNRQLQEALANVKTLSGLLPICANCKKIRDDKGYWNQIEFFIRDRSSAKFSHSMCPECSRTLYPQLFSSEGLANKPHIQTPAKAG
ncbi:MAG: multi-sensor hybrid histidine kinase [Pedosphaera sp.]|nr:multi-sensor hybrid histidine kinase [Pedosphaera sp.]